MRTEIYGDADVSLFVTGFTLFTAFEFYFCKKGLEGEERIVSEIARIRAGLLKLIVAVFDGVLVR